MEQLYQDSLAFQRLQKGINHLRLLVQSNAAVAQTMIGRHIASLLRSRQIEFVLNSRFCTHSLFGQLLAHAFEKRTGTGFPGLPVQSDHIAHHAPSVGYVGSTAKVLGSGIRRNSPTGPIPSTEASDSTPVKACIARVWPIPVRMRVANRFVWVVLPRMIPPLSQYKKRISRSSFS